MPGGDDSRADVLRVIALDGPISRTHIADHLGVSAATVTAVTRDLLGTGLVRMSGKAPAAGRRGRPLELLEIDPDAATVVGCKVAHGAVTSVLTDLRGVPRAHHTSAFDPTAPDPGRRLGRLLAELARSAPGRLVGAGLGVPGTVATDVHGSVTTPMFGWHDLPLGAEVAEALGVPVIVDNDVNTLTVMQGLHGPARGVEDFLTVTVGRGVGLGIHVGGQVHRGRGGAGELGHTRAVTDGPRCDCGRHGCLEAVVADPALLAQAVAAGLVPADADIADVRTLAQGHGPDAEAAAGLFRTAGTHLGHALADLVNLLAPERIILSGEGIAGWPLLEPGVTTAFQDGRLEVHGRTELTVEPWEDDAWAQGAAALVLGTLLGQPPAHVAVADLHSRLHDAEAVAAR